MLSLNKSVTCALENIKYIQYSGIKITFRTFQKYWWKWMISCESDDQLSYNVILSRQNNMLFYIQDNLKVSIDFWSFLPYWFHCFQYYQNFCFHHEQILIMIIMVVPPERFISYLHLHLYSSPWMNVSMTIPCISSDQLQIHKILTIKGFFPSCTTWITSKSLFTNYTLEGFLSFM